MVDQFFFGSFDDKFACDPRSKPKGDNAKQADDIKSQVEGESPASAERERKNKGKPLKLAVGPQVKPSDAGLKETRLSPTGRRTEGAPTTLQSYDSWNDDRSGWLYLLLIPIGLLLCVILYMFLGPNSDAHAHGDELFWGISKRNGIIAALVAIGVATAILIFLTVQRKKEEEQLAFQRNIALLLIGLCVATCVFLIASGYRIGGGGDDWFSYSTDKMYYCKLGGIAFITFLAFLAFLRCTHRQGAGAGFGGHAGFGFGIGGGGGVGGGVSGGVRGGMSANVNVTGTPHPGHGQAHFQGHGQAHGHAGGHGHAGAHSQAGAHGRAGSHHQRQSSGGHGERGGSCPIWIGH